MERKKETQSLVVGKFGDLIESLSKKARTEELGEAALTWFEETLNSFDKKLEKRLEKGVDVYRKALQQRMADIKNKVEFDVQKVQPFQEEAQRLLQNIEGCRNWKSHLELVE